MLMLIRLSLVIGFIAAFAIFFIGAQKVQKNRFLWGALGGLSFVIPTFIFWPILVGSVNAAGNDARAIFISYFVIINAVGVFASIMVYKKFLLKPAQLTVEQNAFIFCSECGTRCSANTAFCNKCGSKIGRA